MIKRIFLIITNLPNLVKSTCRIYKKSHSMSIFPAFEKRTQIVMMIMIKRIFLNHK